MWGAASRGLVVVSLGFGAAGCTRANPAFIGDLVGDDGGTGEGTGGSGTGADTAGTESTTDESGTTDATDATTDATADATTTDGGDGDGDGDGDGTECVCAENEHCSEGTCVLAKRIVVVNFDGGTLVYDPTAGSDPMAGTQGVTSLIDTFPPYAGADREAILAAVQADVEQFLPTSAATAPNGLIVTDVAPTNQRYAMVVVTSENPYMDPNIVAIGEPNCAALSDTTVHFTFLGPDDLLGDPGTRANVVSAGIGNLLGLERIMGPEDVMHQYVQFTDQTFVDACFYDVGSPPFSCEAAHAQFCPPGQQNSVAEIRARVNLP